ncbi:hypothetical protein E2542_SST13123 [Spatholobus suberectus]|nr:hypothetical protein E2542_SST13123 [Spatholobus suberectus]
MAKGNISNSLVNKNKTSNTQTTSQIANEKSKQEASTHNNKTEAEEKLKRSRGKGCRGSLAWWLGRWGASLEARFLHDAKVRRQREDLGDAEVLRWGVWLRGFCLASIWVLGGGCRVFCWWHDDLGNARIPRRGFGFDGSVYGLC